LNHKQLLQKTAMLFIVVFIGVNLSAQNSFVFFGSFMRDKTKESIYVYQLDSATGQLQFITSTKGISNPSFLTVSPNGKFVYACTESKTPNAGSVSSFAFDVKNKTLRFINSQPSGGENPVFVSVYPSGKWLVNANYTQGSVAVYPLTQDGHIDSMVQNIHYKEGSIVAGRQDSAHIHAAVFSPRFDFVFLPDLGADKIRSYPFDATDKTPLQTAQSTFTTTTLGAGPRHFTFHPNGRFAYCIEELSGTISAYKYANGRLDSMQRINTHPEKEQEGYESSDIHISPDGLFLYASNRGDENNIAIFSIGTNGQLKKRGYQSTLGDHPRTFAMDPSGKFLIVTNAVSGNVFVFSRNKKTGLLKKVGSEVKIENVSCVQIARIGG
jgi:6-phosphogluconolactonase